MAINYGATEIDMVINIGAIKSRDYVTVLCDIHAVVAAAKPHPVKVILETAALTRDEKVIVCALSKAANAAYVKTSTGFGGGGATLEDVALMRSIGLRHYRFSIAWSRVMSYDETAQTMVPNEAGLRWYEGLLTALEESGIQPYVTLYHWDLPAAVHEHMGGWHSPDNARVVNEFEK